MCARVLVVDDDPVNIDLVEYLLRAFGHEPVVALGGELALQRAAAETPDLVLCDIQMPDMDGFEVLRRLRLQPRYAATPILGLTALAMVGDREKVLAAGFDGYLTKPITPETFISEIEKYLPAELALRRPLEHAGSPAPARAPHQAPTVRKREGYALVVDDTQPNIDLLEHLLNSLGLEVRTASTAADGLRLARASTPVLIVSDLHMPRRDGLQLLLDVRSDAVLKRIPFVLVSATNASPDELRRATALGVDDMLLRPIEAPAMLERLAKWIPVETD